MPSIGWSDVKLTAIGLWKHVLWSDEITLHHLAVQQMNLGLADARRTQPAPVHNANCKVWWMRNNGLGLGPLVPLKGNINATAYNDILDDSGLPTLRQQFWCGKQFADLQSPDLNHIEH
jgi:hypothetical protein